MKEMQDYTYDSLRYEVRPEVYKPAEDTFLLARILERERLTGKILEIGTGTGLLALISAKTAEQVVATDLNPYAVSNAQRNAKSNQLDAKIEVLRCNLASAITAAKEFDYLILNPPYLPEEPREDWASRSWAGGPSGLEFVERAIDQSVNLLKSQVGVRFLVSGEHRLERVRSHLSKKQFSTYVLDSAAFFYERIFAVRAEPAG